MSNPQEQNPAFDKRSILAFVLIGVIFLVWSVYFAPKSDPKKENISVAQDNTVKQESKPPTSNLPEVKSDLPSELLNYSSGINKNIVIETPLYKATISSKGALLSKFELKKYHNWYGKPAQLICDSANFKGVLGVDIGLNSKYVSTESLDFNLDKNDNIIIGEKDSLIITAKLNPNISSDSNSNSTNPQIEKRFVFYGNKYGIGFNVKTGSPYRLNWPNSINFQEYNSVDEGTRSHSHVFHDGEMKKFDVSKPDEPLKDTVSGKVEWIGGSVKYFGYAIIPSVPINNGFVNVIGNIRNIDSGGHIKRFSLSLNSTGNEGNYTIFLGPLEREIVKTYGLGKLNNFSLEWLTRPISEYFMMPLFNFIHSFINNWGLVIIIFSLIIKTILWPLSLPQMRSAQKMKLLAPLMAENKEKIIDDPQKLQMENAKLYREYGINPMGGCAPMILQLPIFSALWQTLSSAIELRQSSFIIFKDLSLADNLIPLGFNFPLLGSHLSLLAVVMGASMVLQMRLTPTPSSDPNQKMMQYFMPVFLTIMFNSMPAGLNLYYLTFNIASALQQVAMNKFSKSTMTLEDLRREAKTKKQGWFSKKMAEAQKIAEMQQSQKGNLNGRTTVEQKKK
jgi:YidC/Oxa1 family membrane protein insertase